MAEATFTFPRNFYWGTASAAYQVEGGNTNSMWWIWEREGHVNPGDSAAIACDWWGGRAEEDFDRMALTHQNMHRLSLEWSRIEPDPAFWDEDALAKYRGWMQALRERGITPMVTLHHFSDPIWLAEKGGWENDETPRLFERYVRKVARVLGDLVEFWCTINEPNVYVSLGYIEKGFPPGKENFNAGFRAYANLLRGHALAYQTLKSLRPGSSVGWAHHVRGFSPARPDSRLDTWVAGQQDRLFNRLWPEALRTGRMMMPVGPAVHLREVKDTFDWFGINYFSRDLVSFDLRRPRRLFGMQSYGPDDVLSDSGFIALAPEPLFDFLRWARGYGKPIFITENGVCDQADTLRPRYLLEHLRQVWRAVNFNWQVLGYLHWTLVDNFEWERGWTQRFGLWELDLETGERHKRRSAELFAEVCHESALSSDMVRRYAPEVYDRLFPG